MRWSTHQAGFTLIEVLAAAVILAIAMASILAVEVTALQTNRLSRNLQNAAGVAADTLEGVHRQSPLAIASGLRPTVTVEHVVFNPSLTVAPAGGSLYLLTATVTWQDDASYVAGASRLQHSISMQLLKSTLESF